MEFYEEFARQLFGIEDAILDDVLQECRIVKPPTPSSQVSLHGDPRFAPIVEACFASARADHAREITSARMVLALIESRPEEVARVLAVSTDHCKDFTTKLKSRLRRGALDT